MQPTETCRDNSSQCSSNKKSLAVEDILRPLQKVKRLKRTTLNLKDDGAESLSQSQLSHQTTLSSHREGFDPLASDTAVVDMEILDSIISVDAMVEKDEEDSLSVFFDDFDDTFPLGALNTDFRDVKDAENYSVSCARTQGHLFLLGLALLRSQKSFTGMQHVAKLMGLESSHSKNMGKSASSRKKAMLGIKKKTRHC